MRSAQIHIPRVPPEWDSQAQCCAECRRGRGQEIRFTRWFKYDRDDLCVNKSQFVPVIFEPPCTLCAPAVNMWTTEITLKLTDDLRSTPCLFDPSSSAYKYRNKKVLLWIYWLWNAALLSMSWTRNVTLWCPNFDENTKIYRFPRRVEHLQNCVLVPLRATHVSVTSNRVNRLQNHGHWAKGWSKWNTFILSPFSVYLCTCLWTYVFVRLEKSVHIKNSVFTCQFFYFNFDSISTKLHLQRMKNNHGIPFEFLVFRLTLV